MSKMKTTSSKFLFLVRHGESQKNLQRKHGIVESTLTTKGKHEVMDILRLFSEIKFQQRPTLFFSKISYQALETVRIIERNLDCNCVESDMLAPISLGVISGLTEIECKKQFPEISLNIEKWIQGKIDISDFIIPGAESVSDFWNRGLCFVEYVKAYSSPAIVIGDRSIIILLLNHLLKKNIFTNGCYQYFSIPTGGLVSFLLTDREAFFCKDYQTYNLNI